MDLDELLHFREARDKVRITSGVAIRVERRRVSIERFALPDACLAGFQPDSFSPSWKNG
jgi:hypothetical protein